MRGVWIALIALCVLVASAMAGGVAWLASTEPGLRWIIAQIESASGGKLTADGPRGTLIAGISVERLRYDDGAVRVEARDLRAQGSGLALLRGRLGLEPLHAGSLSLALTERDAPSAESRPLALPFGVRAARVSVDRLELRAGPVREVLTEVRLARLILDPHAVSIAGSFARPDARYAARVDFEASGRPESLAARVTVRVAGVRAQANADLMPLEPLPVRSLEVRIEPVELARFAPELPKATLEAVLKARVSGMRYLGSMSIANLSAAPLDEGGLPFIRAHARFVDAQLEGAVLEELRIELQGGGLLEGRGELTERRLRAAVDIQSLDLRALRTDLRRTALHGTADVDLALDRQSVRGVLSEEGMRLEAHVTQDGGRLEVHELRAQSAGGQVRGEGWALLAEPISLEARLELERLDPAAFGDYPEGSINGRLRIAGRLGSDAQLDARWLIENSMLLGEHLESRGEARFSQWRVESARASLRWGAIRATGKGGFGRPGDQLAWTVGIAELRELDERVSGRLQASGTLKGLPSDPEIEAIAQVLSLQVPGDSVKRTARATLAGTRARHEARIRLLSEDSDVEAHLAGAWLATRVWEGEIRSLTNAGLYPLRLIAPAPLRISPAAATLGRFEAHLEEGRLTLRELTWSPGQLRSSGEMSGLPARWLALAAGAGDALQTTLRLDGDWAVAATPQLQGHVRLRRAAGDIAVRVEGSSYPLGLSEASLEAHFVDGTMALQLDAASRFGRFGLDGEVGAGFGPQAALALRARFDAADLGAIAQPLVTQARLDGQLWGDVEIFGTIGAPRFAGTFRGERIGAEVPPYGVYLREGAFQARLDEERLHVESFSIRGGDGEFLAKGSLPLRLAEGGATLAWSAANFGVLERPDMRLTVSGKGEARFDGRRLALAGNLRAERGFLLIQPDRLPRLGEDVVIAGRPARGPAAQAALPVTLDIELDLGNRLSIEAGGLEGRLTGRLQLVGTEGGDLRAYGRLQLVNATYYAYGQRLQVDPGVLIFDGPIRNPGLQVTAWRRNQAVEVGVQVSGNVQAPRVILVSLPPVSEAERLSWLVLGRAPGDASRADLGLLQVAAGELLAPGNALPLDRRFARAVGLDELTLRGGGELEQGVVAFGKRLSDRLYVTYEQGLGAATDNLVKLDYVLGRRWALRAETGTTTSGAGLFYRYSWD